jgi:hypothetical protein
MTTFNIYNTIICPVLSELVSRAEGTNIGPTSSNWTRGNPKHKDCGSLFYFGKQQTNLLYSAKQQDGIIT